MKLTVLRELLKDKRVVEEINKHLWVSLNSAGTWALAGLGKVEARASSPADRKAVVLMGSLLWESAKAGTSPVMRSHN